MRLLLLLLLLPGAAGAHTFAPTLLELREIAPSRFRVSWKPEPLAAEFPCAQRDEVLDCPLQGRRISIANLGDRDALVRIDLLDGSLVTAVLRADAPSFIVPAQPEVRGYVGLGVEHIFGGIDHLLFVLGLFLLSRRRLLWTLSAFTLAHSCTLALAVTGTIHLPQAPVEAAIALSILFLAVELAKDRPSFTREHPWVVALSFGLLHGLGFAGALGEIGLPAGQVAAALLCFNLGVELGQLAFVAALLLFAQSFPPRRAAYVIGALAAAFLVDRIVGFWT